MHYAKEAGTPKGFSLGDWGPVGVMESDSKRPGTRPAAPVLTIEVLHYAESWAFRDGEQIMDEQGQPLLQKLDPQIRASSPMQQGPPYPRPRLFNQQRSRQLQTYAEAIIATVLELP